MIWVQRAAGLADVDTPMAVLVQRMVAARASGVLFTRRPDEPRAPVMLVSAACGLGPAVSAGTAEADELVVSRAAPHHALERRIASKTSQLVSARGGGLERLAVGPEDQRRPALSEDDLSRLAEAALAMERYFGEAQDVEWAIDEGGRLFVLQCRPIHAGQGEAARPAPAAARRLLHAGEAIWPGRAVGPVHVARTEREEDATPGGALLVVPQLRPDCVRLLPRVCGIVVERGSVTGHAASILREFRIPSLVEAKGALDALAPGEMVSLDVAGRSVYAGALWPELRGRLPVTLLGRRPLGLPDALAGKITKLSGTAFMGTWACQSLHDVIRFAHEMAIQSMFELGDRLLDSPIGGVKRLRCAPPLYMHLVDLGGGIGPEAAARDAVEPEEVVSRPFQALWRGLADPRFEPERSEGSGPFGAVLANTMVTSGSRQLGAPNYACITDVYLNLSSRQAYHFTTVDAFLSDDSNGNHVSMRLRGGGAAPRQRNLRAELAAEVLRLHGFTASVTGDLMTAWARNVDAATGAKDLATIGHLLRFLSRLDMWMTDESQVRRHLDVFLAAEAVAAGEPAPPDPGMVSA